MGTVVDQKDAENYGTRALLAVRARFFLVYRLSIRLVPFAWVGGGLWHGWWPFALVGFIGLDVGQWSVLRDPDRFGLKFRLVLDSLDIAIWSLAPYAAGATPLPEMWIAVPLATEAGLRRGLKGMVVPVVTGGVTIGVNAILGRTPPISSFAWLVVAVGWGILLSRYTERLQARTDQECEARSSAECRRALLAGENSLAMGASSVVDTIETVLPVLGAPEPGSVLWTFADAWKLQLAESTAGCATYLGQAVAEWAGELNTHPDLSSRVEVSLAEGIGTTVLTERQAASLRQLLQRLEVRGPVAVNLAEPSAGKDPPGHVGAPSGEWGAC